MLLRRRDREKVAPIFYCAFIACGKTDEALKRRGSGGFPEERKKRELFLCDLCVELRGLCG